MCIPLSVQEVADKALHRLSKKPASLDDLHAFLAAQPSITSPTLLGKYINERTGRREAEHKNAHLPFTRLRLLVSKYGKSFNEEFHAIMNRIRARSVDPSIPYGYYYAQALADKCSCDSPGRSYGLLVSGMEFHDAKEYYGGAKHHTAREHLGRYYDHLVLDSFPARQQSLVILGEMGSGKSVFGRQHLQVYPRDVAAAFVFKPTMEDSFPWTGVPPMVKFVDLNDFRANLSGFTATGILNIGEYAATKVP